MNAVGDPNAVKIGGDIWQIEPSHYLRVGQFGEMLRPDPAHKIMRIVLVFGEPQFTLLGNNVENLPETIS